MKRCYSLFLLFLVCFFSGCKSNVDYYYIPSFSEAGAVNAVVEIPSGTNSKYEYDNESKAFVIDQVNGINRSINFLSYPSNYGFIPSTISDRKEGGDGDALDVLVLSESLKTGTIEEVIPIAMLKLIDKGELDYKIIAVPFDKSKRIVNAVTYIDLKKNYPAIIEIIEMWFLNYNKKDQAFVEGWGNEKDALKAIRNASKK